MVSSVALYKWSDINKLPLRMAFFFTSIDVIGSSFSKEQFFQEALYHYTMEFSPSCLIFSFQISLKTLIYNSTSSQNCPVHFRDLSNSTIANYF